MHTNTPYHHTRTAALALFFVTSALLTLFHAAGVGYLLYENLALFDVLTHFLGGMTAGAGIAWFILLTRPPGVWVRRERRFFAILAAVFIVTLVWEVFEIWIGAPREIRYMLDTLIDIAMGMVGGGVAVLLLRRNV